LGAFLPVASNTRFPDPGLLGAILPLASNTQFPHLEAFGCNFACGIKHPISSSGAFGCNFASGIKHPISSSGGFWVQFCLWHQTLNFLILFAGLLPHGTKPSSYWAGWWTVAGIPNLWT
jgi:hypothetical protein